MFVHVERFSRFVALLLAPWTVVTGWLLLWFAMLLTHLVGLLLPWPASFAWLTVVTAGGLLLVVGSLLVVLVRGARLGYGLWERRVVVAGLLLVAVLWGVNELLPLIPQWG